MTKIIFSNKLPYKGRGILLDYKYSTLEVNGWETIDVRNIIAKHEDEWLENVHNWHAELLERLSCSCKWFGLFPVSRLILWPTTTSFSLKPLLYALAIIKIFETHQKSIWIVSPDKYLRNYIWEYGKKHKIAIIDQFFRLEFSSFTNVIKSFYAQKLFRYKEFFKLAYCLGFQNKRKTKQANIVVSSLFMSENLIDEIGDHYYGHLFDNNNITSQEKVCWIYNDLRIDKKAARMKLDKIGRIHYFLSDFFTWKDLFIAFADASNSLNSMRNFYNYYSVHEIFLESFESKEFSKSYLTNLGLNWFPIFEFLILRLYIKAFNLLSPKNFIYPYEERPFERAMLIATEKCEKSFLSIGYAHAGYSKGHMYIRRQNSLKLPSPSVVFATGKVAKKRFVYEGFEEKSIFVVGTPRYHKPSSNKKQMKRIISSFNLNLLFICGLGFEMQQFAKLLVTNHNLSINYNITIRRSFHSWKYEQDEAEKLLKKHNIAYKCADGALLEEINAADIILFESTSAAFQASLMGKLIIQIQLSDILKTNYFINKNEMDSFLYCKTADELRQNLNFINSLSAKDYQALLKKQRLKVKDIYNPLNINKLKKIFQT